MTATHDKPRRRGRILAIVAFALIGLLLVSVGAVVGTYMFSLQDSYEKRTVVSLERGASDGERPEAPQAEATNILLLGSDKRSPEEAAAAGVYGQRSDVMMLVTIPDDGSEAYVMSFPRDLYVEIPGHGRDRINAALAFGGISLAVATVENYMGIPIDNVALIDFDGIQGLVDTIGGVDVQIPKTFEADGIQFTEGVQHLNGEEALVFVRQRYQFADGDFQRNRNQQAVLKAIVERLISRDVLTSPGALQDAVASISPFLTTDDGLTPGRIAELAWNNRDIRGSSMHFFSVPHGDPYTTSGGASVVATDEEGMAPLREAHQQGTLADYYAENVR